jgi:DeoR family transcriptional regulator of aga operon/DeoR family fructose operon transcriptional repressor
MPNITFAERQNKIVALLKENKVVNVNELSSLFDVSEMTIRRDLQKLNEKGLIERTHGAATLIEKKEYEPEYYIRAIFNKAEKEAIGKVAAAMVKDGETLAMDVGSTILGVAKHLKENQHLTVVTNWIPIVNELVRKRGVRIFLLGGFIRKEELSIVGDAIKEQLTQFKIDKCFLGVSAISDDNMLLDYDLGEVEVKRAWIAAAKETIVVANSSKFGKVAPVKIAPISSVTHILTDAKISEMKKSELEREGVTVIVAR